MQLFLAGGSEHRARGVQRSYTCIDRTAEAEVQDEVLLIQTSEFLQRLQLTKTNSKMATKR